ncbi:NUDIX hydrolase [candidate division KSB1 bacterium]|nr:NUDIX hydrolase [candidate division KSB1 bacterium]
MKGLQLFLRFILASFQRVFYVLSAGQMPPFASVAVLVREGEKILMVERSDGRGWGLPGGFVKMYETAETAARREVCEETGLEIEITGVLGTLSGERPGAWIRSVDVVFSGRITGGKLAASHEGRGAWVQLHEVRSRVAFDYLKILERI